MGPIWFPCQFGSSFVDGPPRPLTLSYWVFAFSYLGSSIFLGLFNHMKQNFGPWTMLRNWPRSFVWPTQKHIFILFRVSLSSSSSSKFRVSFLSFPAPNSNTKDGTLSLSAFFENWLTFMIWVWMNNCYYCMFSRPTRPSWLRRSWRRRWGRIGLSLTGSAWGLTTPSGSFYFPLLRFFFFLCVSDSLFNSNCCYWWLCFFFVSGTMQSAGTGAVPSLDSEVFFVVLLSLLL